MFLGPGPSSCSYFGGVDVNCHFKSVAVSDLPPTCSSFFFNMLTVDTQYDVYNLLTDENNGNYTRKILNTNKIVSAWY